LRPAETGRFHHLVVAGLVLLAIDAVIEAVWRRGSHLD
jgi:hypothetical protein